MKTIIILLMIFGLYACDESTVTQPKDDTKVETQKYTLEEILADTNWVEITDTLHYEEIKQLSYESIGWKSETIKVITNNEEYEKLKQKNDTTHAGYKPIVLREVDFTKYDLIGYYINDNWVEISKSYFINKKNKEYCYILKIKKFNLDKILLYYQNWILVPKLESQYKINIIKYYFWEID